MPGLPHLPGLLNDQLEEQLPALLVGRCEGVRDEPVTRLAKQFRPGSLMLGRDGQVWMGYRMAADGWTGTSFASRTWGSDTWPGGSWGGTANWVDPAWNGRTWNGRFWAAGTWTGRFWASDDWSTAYWGLSRLATCVS